MADRTKDRAGDVTLKVTSSAAVTKPKGLGSNGKEIGFIVVQSHFTFPHLIQHQHRTPLSGHESPATPAKWAGPEVSRGKPLAGRRVK